jgi:hypothetical protein
MNVRIEVYEEFLELLKVSEPKSGELVYAIQRSEKDGNLLLITSASLEVSEETKESKADTYDFALTFNSWFDDEKKLHRSEVLLALLKEKKGLLVDPDEMVKRRKLKNLRNIEKLKTLRKLRKV